MPEIFYQHVLPNGLTILGQKMPGVESAAMSLLIPSGASTDARGGCGSASVLSDLVLRGAGQRSSRELTDHLDRLGLQRGAGVNVYHTRFDCAAVAGNVLQGLSAYADIVRRPHLLESDFSASRDLSLQGLAGLDDEPRQKLLINLRKPHFPDPLGRNSMGVVEDLKKLLHADCRADFAARYQPAGAILAIAGNIDFPRFKADAEKFFSDWKGVAQPPLRLTPPAARLFHEEQKSEQTHIGIAYESLPETHGDYYKLRLAMEVLSGGMSGRLFTEVREKRALVYSVSAGFTGLKDRGSILGYAGTSNDRAQATLDTFIAELFRLCDGVAADELARAKTGLKASMIMACESTSARIGAITHDFFMRGRIRTLDEIKAGIDAVTLDSVNAFLKKHPPGPFTIVTVGPKALKIP